MSERRCYKENCLKISNDWLCKFLLRLHGSCYVYIRNLNTSIHVIMHMLTMVSKETIYFSGVTFSKTK